MTAAKKYKGLIIVESPTKVKKLKEYLGREYKVLASVGHVRDLPNSAKEIPAKYKKLPWGTLGVDVEHDFDPLYIIPSGKKKVIQELEAALEEAEELIIATDGDREGESIGWHLVQVLKPKIPVKRMIFTEITKTAIQHALDNPVSIDQHLVNAQETRRILDRLFGYTLSPLLWKKISSGLSAGRVQSVAVRLLVLRELERKAFRSGTYWDLKAKLSPDDQAIFESQLHSVGGKRIASGKDFDEQTGKLKPDADVILLDEKAAAELKARIEPADWIVSEIEEKEQTRKPYAPFTTSTLQQEANRKLGFSARQTMQTAQRLYENGHITYMRTDSVHLSEEALAAARACVESRYGKDYLSPEARQYTTKTKGAQEGHEAIRPAGTEMRTGEELGLDAQELKLYNIIWMRTVATQMAEARLRFQTVSIQVGEAIFKATGKRIDFPGFFRAYVEGVDDPEAALDDQETGLPELKKDQKVICKELGNIPHETKPPARYTEATLVRKLEEEGIGRPSTYASIISTILDRGYVKKNGNQLVPTFTAMAVTRLLERNFPNLVDLGFTASMEKKLDDIAEGDSDQLPYLKKFYLGENGLREQVKSKEGTIDARESCTLQMEGVDADIRVGRYGPYFEVEEDGVKVTAGIPEDTPPADLNNELAKQLIKDKKAGPQSLGTHPETGLPIFLLRGPYGPYVQLGMPDEDGKKPKRVSIPRNIDPNTVNFDIAVQLLQLPKKLGDHPETGKSVSLGIGRFGPYVLCDGKYQSVPKDQSVLDMTFEGAVELLKHHKGRQKKTPVKELGAHPEDSKPVVIYDGLYGHYVNHGKTNATIGKDRDPQSLTLEEALVLLAEQKGKKKTRRKKR